MAFGFTCPICNGTVDGNEFNHAKGICKDCEYDQEQKEAMDTQAAKFMNADSRQIELEEVLYAN